jgi:hypothetical protein
MNDRAIISFMFTDKDPTISSGGFKFTSVNTDRFEEEPGTIANPRNNQVGE